MPELSTTAICDVSRDGSQASGSSSRTCPVCGTSVNTSARARYCSRACRQRGYRLRRVPAGDEVLANLATRLRRSQAIVDHTVYECPRCDERYLGERRCDGCNLMCRNLGLGGRCLHCDDILLVSELMEVS